MQCLNEYPNALKTLEDWVSSMKDVSNQYTKGEPFHGLAYNYTKEAEALKEDEKALGELVQDFAYGTISKLDYLKKFSKDSQSAHVVNNLNSFVDKIVKKLTEPLKTRLEEIERDFQAHYFDTMRKAVTFERYLAPKTFYNPARLMEIWRVPKPKLENPSAFEDTGREYWKIWDQQVPIEDFTANSALM